MGGAKRLLLPKICHTYPTMMKLGTVTPYLKKIQKIYESRDAYPEFCWHQHFFTRNQQILLYQEMKIAFWYIISNSFNFLESLKIFLINLVKILMMSAKMAPPDLLKITVFWNKGSVVKISFDKVVGHLFTDSISLVNHKEPAWLVLNGEILEIWPVPITRNRYLRLLQKIFLSSVAASNWWLGTWVHGKMCTKDITVSVAFKVFFFAARIKIFMSAMQLNGAHVWSCHHAVNLYRVDCSRCSVEKKLKI